MNSKLHSIFREYDIRGIFGKELNFECISKIGFLLSKRIKKYGKNVGIGYDGRLHSKDIFGYLASGLNKGGLNVYDMGLIPTPINYFASFVDSQSNVCASIQITGSHNPKEYNGLKITINKKPFFAEQIYALRDEVCSYNQIIEKNTKSTKIDILSHYIDYMVNEFSALKDFKEQIIIDCGNGVAGVALCPIFDRLNLNYKAMFAKPDGDFPNHHPDPNEEKNLKDIKKELSDNDIGFAYDGDGDRVVMLIGNKAIASDKLAIVFAKSMQDPIVIGEVKCSSLMYEEINKIGKAYMYKTGHSNIKTKIKELNATFGAEISGHIFFNDKYFGFDDAIYATLRVIELMHKGINIKQQLSSLPKKYDTEEIKININENIKFNIIEKIKYSLKNPPSCMPKIKKLIFIDGIRIEFEQGWGLIRASNTTPTLVMKCEANTIELLNLYKSSLDKILQNNT